MRYLIVNADDFGLSDYINEGIMEGYLAGSITSTTLMINREFAPQAVALAKKHPGLCVGLHLDLDHLLGRDEKGSERFGMERISRMLAEPEFFRDVDQEIEGQISRFKGTRLTLTHIDGHHHLHAIPEIFPLVVEKMVAHGIKTIRFSGEFDLIKYPPIRWSPEFYESMKGLIKRHSIRTAAHFVTGWQPFDLNGISEGVTELMTHPGTREEWRVEELRTLTSPAWKERLAENGIRLISFRDLAEMPVA